VLIRRFWFFRIDTCHRLRGLAHVWFLSAHNN
jgi:hypothetical protein